MDDILKLVDELRKRGAIEISTKDLSVKFATPAFTDSIKTEETFKLEPDVNPEHIDALMYQETSRL